MVLLVLFLSGWIKCERISDKHPKVSVVIPVYNVETKISICLNSILKQTLEDIEVICVDDGSEDKSLKLLNELAENDERIIVVHQKNCGPACARNKGISLASGEYLGFVDSDDWVEAALFKTAYERAKVDDVDVVEFGVASWENKVKVPKGNILRGTEAAKNFISWNLGGQGVPFIWSRIYRRSLISENNVVFDTSVTFGVEDSIFNLDLIPFVKSIAFLNVSFYHYTRHKTSLSNNYKAKDTISLSESVLVHLKKIEKCLKCISKDDLKRIRKTVLKKKRRAQKRVKEQVLKGLKNETKEEDKRRKKT